jgi:tRNA-2-methylthio-N6-dimethylallyladenosine synthase
MENKSFFIKSYGCQMNEYDSEKIASILKKDGYMNTGDVSNADLVVFNTCNIREKAAQKVYSDIGRVTKKDDSKTIALVGCVAQAENDEIFKKNKNVDIVLGTTKLSLIAKDD